MESSLYGGAATLPSTPIIQHVAGWDSLYYDFGVRNWVFLLCEDGITLHCSRKPRNVNGSLKGKDWPFDEQFDNIHEFANHGLFHANQVSFTVVVLDEAWDGLEGPDTQKWLRRWVPLRTILHEVPFFSKVEGSLAEVQADWEDLKEMLSPIEAVLRYNRLFT